MKKILRPLIPSLGVLYFLQNTNNITSRQVSHDKLLTSHNREKFKEIVLNFDYENVKEIKMFIFKMDSKEFQERLLKVIENNSDITIKIIADHENKKNAKNFIKELKKKVKNVKDNLLIKYDQGKKCHAKGTLIKCEDKNILRIGSYNYSESSIDENLEIVYQTFNTNLVNKFETEFEKIFNTLK